jgi:hypothetical protein
MGSLHHLNGGPPQIPTCYYCTMFASLMPNTSLENKHSRSRGVGTQSHLDFAGRWGFDDTREVELALFQKRPKRPFSFFRPD